MGVSRQVLDSGSHPSSHRSQNPVHSSPALATLGTMANKTMFCRYCGATFELPPECADKFVLQAINRKDPETQRLTGEVIIMVNSTRVHECRHEPHTGD
jgi:hypothetical protein